MNLIHFFKSKSQRFTPMKCSLHCFRVSLVIFCGFKTEQYLNQTKSIIDSEYEKIVKEINDEYKKFWRHKELIREKVKEFVEKNPLSKFVPTIKEEYKKTLNKEIKEELKIIELKIKQLEKEKQTLEFKKQGIKAKIRYRIIREKKKTDLYFKDKNHKKKVKQEREERRRKAEQEEYKRMQEIREIVADSRASSRARKGKKKNYFK